MNTVSNANAHATVEHCRIFNLNSSERCKGLTTRLALYTIAYFAAALICLLVLSGILLVSSLAILTLSMVTVGVLLIQRLRCYRDFPVRCILQGDNLYFPRLLTPSRYRRYNLKQLYSLEIREKTHVGFLTLGFLEGGHLIVLSSWMADMETYCDLKNELRKHLENSENNKARLATRDRLFREYQRPPIITLSCLLLLIICFLLQQVLTHEEDRVSELLRLGGLNAQLVLAGEYYRLATASLLHLDWTHLFSNLFTLLAFGNMVEPVIGRYRLMIILLCSALIGAITSTIFPAYVVSIGASGGIYGLVGAYIFIRLFLYRSLPASLNINRPWILYLVVITTMIYGYLTPNIDFYTHLGGMISGFSLVGFWLSVSGQQNMLALRKADRALRLTAFALMGAYIISIVSVAYHNLGYSTEAYRHSRLENTLWPFAQP